MTVTHLLTEPEEAALAIAVEVGVLAEEALARPGAPASPRELSILVSEGQRAREALLLANAGLVKTIARGELGLGSKDFPEIVQEGFLAMAEALLRYDHRRGRFGPYAAAWIRAAVHRAVTTQCGRVEVPVKTLVRHYARRRAEYDASLEAPRRASSPKHEAVRATSKVTGVTVGWMLTLTTRLSLTPPSPSLRRMPMVRVLVLPATMAALL